MVGSFSTKPYRLRRKENLLKQNTRFQIDKTCNEKVNEYNVPTLKPISSDSISTLSIQIC